MPLGMPPTNAAHCRKAAQAPSGPREGPWFGSLVIASLRGGAWWQGQQCQHQRQQSCGQQRRQQVRCETAAAGGPGAAAVHVRRLWLAVAGMRHMRPAVAH